MSDDVMTELRRAARVEALALRSMYRITVSCVQCGGPLQHLANGATSTLRTAAVAVCPVCKLDHAVLVEMVVRLSKQSYGRQSPAPQTRSFVSRGPQR